MADLTQAKEPNMVIEVQSFRTSDNKLHETKEQAVAHEISCLIEKVSGDKEGHLNTRVIGAYLVKQPLRSHIQALFKELE